jgi:AraC family transcriptional regulator of adaptative response/methylated-DNA-[protein]-cysteine methyltransferase
MNMIARVPAATPTEQDPRWQDVVARNKDADGRFFYSVKTTGVYCRPSCAARLAKPQNVRFHATTADAERAGFRACKRCKPDDVALSERWRVLVTEACRRIEAADEVPKLSDLAARAGLSPSHFHRLFKSIAGVTPKNYAAAHRGARVRNGLTQGGSVTGAIYGAGFNSSGRFYETSNELLGMTPKAFRDGGANTEIRFAVGECSLGSILVAMTGKGVCAILFGDDPDALVRELQDRFPKATLIGGDRAFEKIVAKVVGFVEAPAKGLDLPLDIRGTAFQQRVWQALRKIPAGKTATYADIAKRIGAPNAVRAVGTACGANPIGVAIPCHRVVRSNGGLAGYYWGVERKMKLLDREAGKK